MPTQDIRNADGDHATLESRPGNRTLQPVLALGPRPSAGAGRQYHPDDLERIDPIRHTVIAAFWMLCGAALFGAAYVAWHLLF